MLTRDLAVCLMTLGLAIMVTTAPAGAKSGPWLSNAEIVKKLSGRLLEGAYATGRRFSERYREDGRVDYSEDGLTIEGHWSATADTLCTIYDGDSTGGCFRVAPSGRNCLDFYFVSRTEETAPGPDGTDPSWTARGTVEGEADACHEISNV